MAIDFPVTFSLAPLPTGQQLDGNQYGQLLVGNLQAFIAGDFLAGQIGGTPPTTNIGVWFNNGIWYYWDPNTSTYIPQTLTSSFPTGSILDFAGVTPPTGFVLCDGALYLRTGAMATLFAVIGTQFGVGDGSSTFNVPDCRGRTSIGVGTGSGLTPRTLATKLGEEGHVLISAENAPHTHVTPATSHAHTASGVSNPHTHQVSAFTNTVQGLQAGGATYFLPGTVNTSVQSDNGVAVTVNGQTIPAQTSSSSGSGTAHNTMQPSIVFAKIIKT